MHGLQRDIHAAFASCLKPIVGPVLSRCTIAILPREGVEGGRVKCVRCPDQLCRYLWTESIDKSFERFLLEGARNLVEGFEEEGLTFRDIMERIKAGVVFRTFRLNTRPAKRFFCVFFEGAIWTGFFKAKGSGYVYCLFIPRWILAGRFHPWSSSTSRS